MAVRFAVLRHPVSRIMSAWRNKWAEVPLHEWWPQIKKNPRFDVHTYPQSEWLGGDATELVCLEDIAVWMPEYYHRYPDLFPKEMREQRNKSAHIQNPPQVMVDDIAECYADDLMLWTAHRRPLLRSCGL